MLRGSQFIPERRKMCEKCVEIDKQIERYVRIKRTIGDAATIEMAEKLIAELSAEKAELHPNE